MRSNANVESLTSQSETDLLPLEGAVSTVLEVISFPARDGSMQEQDKKEKSVYTAKFFRISLLTSTMLQTFGSTFSKPTLTNTMTPRLNPLPARWKRSWSDNQTSEKNCRQVNHFAPPCVRYSLRGTTSYTVCIGDSFTEEDYGSWSVYWVFDPNVLGSNHTSACSFSAHSEELLNTHSGW